MSSDTSDEIQIYDKSERRELFCVCRMGLEITRGPSNTVPFNIAGKFYGIIMRVTTAERGRRCEYRYTETRSVRFSLVAPNMLNVGRISIPTLSDDNRADRRGRASRRFSRPRARECNARRRRTKERGERQNRIEGTRGEVAHARSTLGTVANGA